MSVDKKELSFVFGPILFNNHQSSTDWIDSISTYSKNAFFTLILFSGLEPTHSFLPYSSCSLTVVNQTHSANSNSFMIYNSAIPQRPNVSSQMLTSLLKNSNVLISLSFCCSRTIRYPGVSSTTCCLIALASNEVRTDNATWAALGTVAVMDRSRWETIRSE